MPHRLGTKRRLFAASGFRGEMSTAIQRIHQTPYAYPRADAGMRRILLDPFPFTIDYRVALDAIVVVAVAHQQRRPGYWSSQ